MAPDLLTLLRAYEAELAGAKLTDWPGVLAIAAETAAKQGATTQHLLQLPMLLLDVPIANKAEFSLIATLCSSAGEMLATVPAADEPITTAFGTAFVSRSRIRMNLAPLWAVETTAPARWRASSVTSLARTRIGPYRRATKFYAGHYRFEVNAGGEFPRQALRSGVERRRPVFG